MSTDSSEPSLGTSAEIQKLEKSLEKNINDVTHVEARISQGNMGQHVEYHIYVNESIENPDIRVDEIKYTQIQMLFSDYDDEDYWYKETGMSSKIVLCTAGLNPNPEQNTGKHTL